MQEQKPERRQAQHEEQEMRDQRDRATQERTPGPGEPRYRNGADTSDLGSAGWSEAEQPDEPDARN